MPKDSSNFTASLARTNSYLHWIFAFVVCVSLGVWFGNNQLKLEREDHMSYYAPKIELLRKKMPAIRISSIDFLSDTVRDKLQELAYQMEFICTQRSDDAVFAFQFGSDNHSRFREDHMFALCEGNQIFGNAEVVSFSDEMVLCTEEYDGVLKQVKRPASIYLKAIDIEQWDVVEVNIEDSRKACVVQHAIDVLESKWV
tara:strand:- start:1539 stop:2135 length:597 start_codon:yes stop_codon:yes gene_type:complete